MKPQGTILKEKQMSFLTSKSDITIYQRTAWAELAKLMADLGDMFALSPLIFKLHLHFPFSMSLKYTKLPPASGLVYMSVTV